jgi:acetyltransferase-like isoleucine patch superfamily enzyme
MRRISTRTGIHSTCSISRDAVVGEGVSIGAFSVIHANVHLGDGCLVDSHVVLGSPTGAYYEDPDQYEPRPCRVGPSSVIRSHAVIYAGVTIGADFGCGHHVTIREGARIGDGVRIGTLCDVQPDAAIGNYARLHSNVFVARGSTIDELTWLLPYSMLIDDPHPPSDSCTVGPTIRRFAVIGAGSTIFPGVEVGEGAVVGASSLVRSNVPPAVLVIGTPARVFGSTADIVCHDGRIEQVYPWWLHFRRGYPDGVLPDEATSDSATMEK